MIAPSKRLNSRQDQQTISTATINATLKKLSVWWRKHHRTSLLLRHRTGIQLNRLLGNPNRRSEYGDGTVQKVSQQLAVSRSEIYRMRQFAARFLNFSKFTAKHPTIKTWTKVKVMMGESANTPNKSSRRKAAVVAVSRSIHKLTKRLRSLPKAAKSPLSGLEEELKELAKTLRATLGVTVRIGSSR